MKQNPISHRAQVLLKHLVEMYLRDGQPVGSKTLVNTALPMLSPATVRKVLGDLEELGYLVPRIPLQGEYRQRGGFDFL